MQRALRTTTSLVAAVAASLGIANGAPAAGEGASLTQPATELVMPFDATSGKASFLLVSNRAPSTKVSTRWVFWGQDCRQLAEFSACLTQNDTIVVDPTNAGTVDQGNNPVGPRIDLSGERGLVTVVAYETDAACSAPGPTSALAEHALVGTFTMADKTAGYSFGNDALGLFVSFDAVDLPAGPGLDGRYVLQALNPQAVDASLVVLGWLATSGNVVVPSKRSHRLFTTFHDTLEVATSLPDVQLDSIDFRSLSGPNALIPDFVTVSTSGLLSLDPLEDYGNELLFAIVGQAVGTYGESSRAKIDG